MSSTRPGLRLIFTSRKEAAERFKQWLTHEVLPSIRKTGGYQLNRNGEVPVPDALRKAADHIEEHQMQIVELMPRTEEEGS